MNLQKYCEQDNIRYYLSKPFNIEGRTVATNGHILVSVPKQEGYAENEKEGFGDRVLKILSEINPAKFKKAHKFSLPESQKCGVCTGLGKAKVETCPECAGGQVVCFENSLHEYEAECKTCDGEGDITIVGGDEDCPECFGSGLAFEQWARIYIYGCAFPVAAKYAKLMEEFPNLEIYSDDELFTLYFRSGEILGMLKGMKE